MQRTPLAQTKPTFQYLKVSTISLHEVNLHSVGEAMEIASGDVPSHHSPESNTSRFKSSSDRPHSSQNWG